MLKEDLQFSAYEMLIEPANVSRIPILLFYYKDDTSCYWIADIVTNAMGNSNAFIIGRTLLTP